MLLLQLTTLEVATSLFLSRHHFTFSVVFNGGHDVATSVLMSQHQLLAHVLLKGVPGCHDISSSLRCPSSVGCDVAKSVSLSRHQLMLLVVALVAPDVATSAAMSRHHPLEFLLLLQLLPVTNCINYPSIFMTS